MSIFSNRVRFVNEIIDLKIYRITFFMPIFSNQGTLSIFHRNQISLEVNIKMRLFLTALLIYALNSVLVHAESLSSMTFGDAIVTEVVSVYDGDTFKVHIACWPDIIGFRISIRIAGIDTPEIRGKCQAEKDSAQLAQQFVADKLHSAQTIKLRKIRRDKYFRVLADVFVDEVNLADAIIEAGLAVVYDGKTKTQNWCESVD